MKTRVIILAGGAGTRLGVLTTKRTKPAVPFGGKYRIIDFPLSNCVNSSLYDVMIIAQYMPRSLIEHIGAGGPWDLNRDWTGGIRIYTPYSNRSKAEWFSGTADAVQQNFNWVRSGNPDLLLILSGDHVYKMDYSKMIEAHLRNQADLTVATIRVPIEEASRFGIMDVDPNQRISAFIEKPADPPSNLANMGVYLFNTKVLDQALWEDYQSEGSTHDFGKDILPKVIKAKRAFAYPFSNYWVDVGTVQSYWKAHMDLLKKNTPMDLFDRTWIIHTRSEERPPALIHPGAIIDDTMINSGCVIESGAVVRKSVLSPGVVVQKGARVEESILLTDTIIGQGAHVFRGILDKRVQIDKNVIVGSLEEEIPILTMIGKNAHLPEGATVEAGAQVGPDVLPEDLPSLTITAKQLIQTRRLPYEI